MLAAGEEEQAVDRPVHALQLLQLRLEQAHVLGLGARPTEDDLALSRQRRQRRLQFVREIGGELVELRVAFLQAGQHGVDALHQRPEFLGNVRSVQPQSQALRPDGGSLRAQPPQGCQSPPDHRQDQRRCHTTGGEASHRNPQAVFGQQCTALWIDSRQPDLDIVRPQPRPGIERGSRHSLGRCPTRDVLQSGFLAPCETVLSSSVPPCAGAAWISISVLLSPLIVSRT